MGSDRIVTMPRLRERARLLVGVGTNPTFASHPCAGPRDSGQGMPRVPPEEAMLRQGLGADDDGHCALVGLWEWRS